MKAQAITKTAATKTKPEVAKLSKAVTGMTGDQFFAFLEEQGIEAVLSKTGRSMMIECNIGTATKPMYLKLTAPIGK